MESVLLRRYLLALALLPGSLAAADAGASAQALSGSGPKAAPLGLSAPAQDEDTIEDADATPSAAPLSAPDLQGLSSTVLVALAKDLDSDKDAVFYDPAQNLDLAEPSAGAWKVDAQALYLELARRACLGDDKDSRQALALAILGGDERARSAKEFVTDEQKAAALIPQADRGDAKAKAALRGLADKGDPKALAYLGLDAGALKPPALAAAAAATPTAAAGASATAAPGKP
jgi:hypothetical protein